MGEYERKQREQCCRAITSNRLENNQLKKFIDNRPSIINQRNDIKVIKQDKLNIRQFYFRGYSDFKYSDNWKYAVKGDSNELYVNENTQGPHPSSFFEMTRAVSPPVLFPVPLANMGIYKYSSKKTFRNDCGDFAAALITQDEKHLNCDEQIRVQAPDIHPVSKITKQAIPDDLRSGRFLYGIQGEYAEDDTNPISADEFNMGTAAAPNIGEAYFMGRKVKQEVGQNEFHVAAVVAVDGNDRITCEADADKEGSREPFFEMYGTQTPERTFHNQYKNSYGNETSITTIARK